MGLKRASVSAFFARQFRYEGPGERLRGILEAIDRIDQYTARGRDAFQKDDLIQIWMVHHLQIIGEAAARLGREFHALHPKAPWTQIIAMRNVLAHEYFGVDLNELWNVVERDRKAVRSGVERLLAQLDQQSGGYSPPGD